ncbi:hypothetical protein [Vibrio sp. 10N.261.52.A1]|uniref:hypothetical protein n=1 Tax=Vibrio TaxID=662 RepID=UPI000C829119|nr:hypothetical protein [Vibrio sp. 10N.261.52.A1]CAH6783371.1 conserved exported hypothetical protein [Vibrio chagasii]PML27667.1 hypothetical protein BCT81_21815 [Vibrio sp. 10N.261.52.A1]CAH6797228.1 conserved exported hypothetical protein [Vibrio chagasii]CAH6907671.1 conserved exported hypothetical protein [Vibrio chagasii]CAH7084368.1 conserved exported hypothetical protein [Vibrio chagasii]
MKTRFKTATFLLASLALFACKDKADIYANPPANLVEQIEAYYPLSIKYVKKHEQIALSQGVPLRPQYLKIARDIGIQNPEKIRVLYVDKMPLPENESLRFQMQRLGLDSPYFTGTAFGYGIWIANRAKGDKLLLAHELIHVKQAEDLGIEAFTKKYLLQLAVFGYGEAPIELEAYNNAPNYL